MDKDCPNCFKTFSTVSSCRRHVKTCQKTDELDQKTVMLILEQFKNLRKEMISLKEETIRNTDKIHVLEEENKQLKAQMLQISSTKQASTLVNQGTIINGDQNNYHIQVNINLEHKPLNFGRETTDHISKKTIRKLVDKYGFSKVLADIVKQIYNNPKIPANMTIKLCPCNDPTCMVVAVHVDDEWRKKDLPEVAEPMQQKISDMFMDICPEDVFEEGTKLNKFDNELCATSSSKNYDIKAIKSGLISKEIQCG